MKIVFILKNGEEKEVEAAMGQTLMEVANQYNIPLIFACGGAGVCGRCAVKIDLSSFNKISPLEDEEDDILKVLQMDEGARLACQVALTDKSDGLRVTI